jgi:hypothetical protein
MLRKLGLMTMFAAGLAAVVAAADLNGRWEAKIAGPDGDFDLVFTFTVDGERLGGTVDGPGGTLQISNGTIKGDAIAFDVKLEGDATITHEGTVKGDEIAMKSKGPWGESEFTLKRAAKKQ